MVKEKVFVGGKKTWKPTLPLSGHLESLAWSRALTRLRRHHVSLDHGPLAHLHRAGLPCHAVFPVGGHHPYDILRIFRGREIDYKNSRMWKYFKKFFWLSVMNLASLKVEVLEILEPEVRAEEVEEAVEDDDEELWPCEDDHMNIWQYWSKLLLVQSRVSTVFVEFIRTVNRR